MVDAIAGATWATRLTTATRRPALCGMHAGSRQMRSLLKAIDSCNGSRHGLHTCAACEEQSFPQCSCVCFSLPCLCRCLLVCAPRLCAVTTMRTYSYGPHYRSAWRDWVIGAVSSIRITPPHGARSAGSCELSMTPGMQFVPLRLVLTSTARSSRATSAGSC